MSRKANHRNFRPSLQLLEGRTLPAISLANGVISITGTDLADTARVTYDDRGTFLNIRDDRLSVTLSNSNSSELRQYDLFRAVNTISGIRWDLNVIRVDFFGRGGNDVFSSDNSVPVVAAGESGSDSLYGGTGADTLEGGSGADYIRGDRGDDNLAGYYRGLAGAGADGNDTIAGGAGNDTLSGCAGNDTLGGDEDADSINGNDGLDTLFGGVGLDTLYGGAGNDSLHGDADADYLSGDADDDSVWGGDGNDTLYGGYGGDTLRAEAGDDRVYGNENDDELYGGGGRDSLEGGEGADTVRGDGDNDTVAGNGGTDTLYGGDGNDTMRGGDEADTIYGNEGNDTCHGGWGDDRIFGHAGDDDLYGDEGNDRLFGWLGNDELYGGADNDWLEAGSAEEAADGGSGEDFNAHVWAVDGAACTDIHQGNSDTCTFLATLSSLARTGTVDLEARISYRGDYTYIVSLYSETGMVATRSVTFDGTYITEGPGDAFDGGATFYDPAPSVEGESWVILMQRAYAGLMSFQGMVDTAEYRLSSVAYHALTGHTGEYLEPDDFSFADLSNYIADGDRTIVAGTWDDADDLTSDQLVEWHTYTVIRTRVDEAGNRFVMLRNPWGYDGGDSVTGDPDDGLVEISWADFRGSFSHMYVGDRL
jgi:Ca2+-binding RTX toxin-like protein